mgnify:CR=1 FL=1
MGYTTLALDIIFINIDHVTQILKTKLTIMKKINNKLLVAFSVMVFLSSCNKEPEALPAIVIPPYPSGTTLAATIAANVNDSLYNRITARMCLSHTSGFPNWRWDNPDQKLRVNLIPGSRYSYSGEGLVYLQVVLEHLPITILLIQPIILSNQN